MNAPTTPLHVLVASLRAAKQAENDARNVRLGIEQQILLHYLPPESGEGIQKGNGFDIAYKLIRSVDTTKLQADWSSIPTQAQKAFRWGADVDIRNLRALDEQNAYLAQTYITSKAAKPTITLKEIKDE